MPTPYFFDISTFLKEGSQSQKRRFGFCMQLAGRATSRAARKGVYFDQLFFLLFF